MVSEYQEGFLHFHHSGNKPIKDHSFTKTITKWEIVVDSNITPRNIWIAKPRGQEVSMKGSLGFVFSTIPG
jgi:hypothetical protein